MNIIKNKLSARIISLFVMFSMLFTVVPIVNAADEVQYEPYTFVVTSEDTISVSAGDEIIITVKAYGPMAYGKVLQFELHYLASDLSYVSEDSDWFEDMESGIGWGFINNYPAGYEQKSETDSSFNFVPVGYTAARKYIKEGNILFNANEAVVAKLIFKANKDIDDISSVMTVKNAKNAFASTDGKETVKSYDDTETTVFQLSQTIDAIKVKKQISELPAAITYSTKENVKAARDAYDALSSQYLKDLVTNYATLQAAEATIATIEANIKGFKDAVAEVKKVDLTTYEYDPATDTLGTLIDNAYAEYAKISVELQSEVIAEKTILDTANTTYTNHETAYEAAKPINDRIAILKTKLDTNEKVEYSDGTEITAIDVAIGSLSDLAKTYIYTEELEAVREAWNTLNEAVTEFNGIVNALDAEKVTIDDKLNINRANSIYSGMDDSQKEAVKSNKEKLDLCIANLNASRIANVKTLIDAIGEVSYTAEYMNAVKNANAANNEIEADGLTVGDEYKNKLEKAVEERTNLNNQVKRLVTSIYRELPEDIDDFSIEEHEDTLVYIWELYYDRLNTEEQQAYFNTVTNPEAYERLVAFQEKYEQLIAEQNQKAADAVIANIEEIAKIEFSVDNMSSLKDAIDAARASYNGLDSASAALVTNLGALNNAEAEYAKLEKAKPVYEKINALDEIALGTEAGGTAIEDAQAAYDALADEENGSDIQAYVTNYSKIAQKRGEHEDQERINAVSDEIEAFLDWAVEYTKAYLEELERIEALYAGLGNLSGSLDEQLVSDFNSKKSAYEQLEIAGATKVNNLVTLVGSIGDISGLTMEDTETIRKITDAKATYDKMTDLEQEQFKNNEASYDALMAAWEEYVKIDTTLKTKAPYIESLIGSIEDVDLNDADLIADIQEELDKNPGVETYIDPDKLAFYEQAKETLAKLQADEAAINNVKKLIDAIFTGSEEGFEDEFDVRVANAKAAYEALESDELRNRVTNYNKIETAKNQKAALENVLALIEAIGEVEFTTECKEKIKGAEEAYNDANTLYSDVTLPAPKDLADELAKAKAEIDSIWNAYKNIAPTHGDELVWVKGYNHYMAVYTNIDEGRAVSLGGYEAAMFENYGVIYYVVLIPEEGKDLNPEDVVVSEGASKEYVLGDVNGDADLTGPEDEWVASEDAYAANAKAARVDNAEALFANDPMAYVRADLDGSGTITAVDALMAARIVNGEKDAFKVRFYTGNVESAE